MSLCVTDKTAEELARRLEEACDRGRLAEMAARMMTDRHDRCVSGEDSQVLNTLTSPRNDFAFCSTTEGSISRCAGC